MREHELGARERLERAPGRGGSTRPRGVTRRGGFVFLGFALALLSSVKDARSRKKEPPH